MPFSSFLGEPTIHFDFHTLLHSQYSTRINDPSLICVCVCQCVSVCVRLCVERESDRQLATRMPGLSRAQAAV